MLTVYVMYDKIFVKIKLFLYFQMKGGYEN